MNFLHADKYKQLEDKHKQLEEIATPVHNITNIYDPKSHTCKRLLPNR